MPNLNLYLTDIEYTVVRGLAKELGVSNAYIVRLSLRDRFGLSLGGRGATELEYVTEVAPERVRQTLDRPHMTEI